MVQDYAGRAVLVTGSARGIGQVLARRFAERGAFVIGVDLLDLQETGRIVCDTGASWLGVQADLTSQADVARIVREVAAGPGRVDVLVNCAAVMSDMAWEDVDFATWRHVMAVNVDALFLMCEAFVPMMREAGYGRIINFTSSVVGMSVPRQTVYRTSKMAVIGLTRGLAADLGGYGITANAVSPSLVMTPGSVELGMGAIESALVNMQCIKRPSTPDDVATLVLFLGSAAAEFITGQTMYADGGWAFR